MPQGSELESTGAVRAIRRVSEPEPWPRQSDVSAEMEGLDPRSRRPRHEGQAFEPVGSTDLLDDQLLADLSGRVSQVLLAAKSARDEIINQARERAALLEHGSRQQAEREASEFLQRARRKGQALFDDARRSAETMLAEARSERDAMLADLVARRAMLEEEVESRQVELAGLREACAAISAMVDDVLHRFGDSTSGSPTASQGGEVIATQRRRLMASMNSGRGLKRPS